MRSTCKHLQILALVQQHTVYLHNYTFGDFGYHTLHYQVLLTSYTISCINELKVHKVIQSKGRQSARGSSVFVLIEMEVRKQRKLRPL